MKNQRKQNPGVPSQEKPNQSAPTFGDRPWQSPDYGEVVISPEEPAKEKS